MVRGPWSVVRSVLGRLLLALGLLLSAPLVSAESVTLAWDPSASTNVVGYRIHYGFTNGVYPLLVEAGPRTNVTINLPVAGTTHHFVATAYDDTGRESDYSEGVSYTTGGELPKLVDQSLETLEDQPIALPWGDQAGYTADAVWFVALPPGRGLLTDENGRPVYAPFQDTNGTDDFVYYVVDRDRSYRVTSHLLVQPVNDPPWAWESDVQTDLNTAATVMLQGWDPEEDALSYEVVTPPRHGLLQGEGGERIYEPATEFSGLDSFQYVSRDGLASSQPATVWIWVGMPEGTPAAFDLEVDTVEDQFVAVELQGRDPDWDPLSFEIVVLPEHGTLVGEGAAWVYVPQPDFHGTDAFQYLASDGTGNSEPATVRIAVASVNDPPVAWDLDLGTNEDAALEITPAAMDMDGDPLTFELLTLPQHGTLQGQGAGWVYEPQPDFHGTEGFVYAASDGAANSMPATVRIVVAPVNDPPVARGLDLSTEEDGALEVTFEAVDVDGDALTFEVLAVPRHGTLRGEGALRVYEPQSDFYGGDEFQYRVSDGLTNSEPAMVRITVASVNDSPVARNLELNTEEDRSLEVTLEAADADGDALTFEILVLPQHGTLVGEGSARVYTPQPDFHGMDGFQYGASDGLTTSEPATVRIVVAPVNDPPAVRGASYDVIEGIARDFYLEGDDPDGDPLTFRITQAPAHGTLSGSLPQVRYEPEAGYTGSDRWEFAASDGQLDSTAGVVIVEVLPKAAFETTLTVKSDGGQLWLSWGVVPGARYRLWQRRDLFEGDWAVIQEISAAGPGQETITVLLPETEGYYRCEVLAY